MPAFAKFNVLLLKVGIFYFNRLLTITDLINKNCNKSNTYLLIIIHMYKKVNDYLILLL